MDSPNSPFVFLGRASWTEVTRILNLFAPHSNIRVPQSFKILHCGARFGVGASI